MVQLLSLHSSSHSRQSVATFGGEGTFGREIKQDDKENERILEVEKYQTPVSTYSGNSPSLTVLARTLNVENLNMPRQINF